MTDVAVLGMGEMGTAVAAAFVAGGHDTTTWNRTPGRAVGGARAASTVRDAVSAADLVVVCVKGNDAALEVLAAAGDALTGRAVLNLTDGTAGEVRAVASWASERGVPHLHGQVMTIAPGVGHPEAAVFFGGSAEVYHAHRQVLDLLGGRGSLVSDDPGVPVLYGMAVHGTMWGALNGFLHAAALLSAHGLSAGRFLEVAGTSLDGLLPGLADEVDRGSYATPFGGLKHHLPSVRDLVRESRADGIDVSFPAFTLDLVEEAVAAGHGDDSYSRLVERFRRVADVRRPRDGDGRRPAEDVRRQATEV